MHSTPLTQALAIIPFLVIGAVAQDLGSLCTVSPAGCTIGPTACPTGCIKSARCRNPCPPQKTVVATYTSRTTATSTKVSTSTVTKSVTTTKTVVATPTVEPATCAAEVPYVNLFTFPDQGCATAVTPDPDLLCLINPPKVNFTFSGPANKINTPTVRKLEGTNLYHSASDCVNLAVQDSYSAYFTIDGVTGTNATAADCGIYLFSQPDCQGFQDGYNITKAETCVSLPWDEDAWQSAYFQCLGILGPA